MLWKTATLWNFSSTSRLVHKPLISVNRNNLFGFGVLERERLKHLRMKVRLPILATFMLLTINCYSQDAYDRLKAPDSEDLLIKQKGTRLVTKPGERYLIIDHSSFFGGYQRYRYFPGENIRFRLKDSKTKFNERIGEITDTTFTFVLVNEGIGRMEHREVSLGDVRVIKTTHRIPWVSEGSFMLPLAGLIYIGADFFNKGLDGKRFTTDQQALWVGGGLIATGLICYKFTFHTIKVGKKNKLRVLQTY
jgi:hypothetical protein